MISDPIKAVVIVETSKQWIIGLIMFSFSFLFIHQLKAFLF